jgi:hypothetical protein
MKREGQTQSLFTQSELRLFSAIHFIWGKRERTGG